MQRVGGAGETAQKVMRLIPNKRTFYRMAMEGKFGNVPRMWWSYADFVADGSPLDLLTIRSLTPSNPKHKPLIPVIELEREIARTCMPEGSYIISEAFPACNRILQGEISYVNGELVFFHTFDDAPMRYALEKDGRHAYGWRAKELLRKHAPPSEAESILDLLDTYSCGGIYETCIEITIHDGSIPFGIYPWQSTIVWEVRQY